MTVFLSAQAVGLILNVIKKKKLVSNILGKVVKAYILSSHLFSPFAHIFLPSYSAISADSCQSRNVRYNHVMQLLI